MVTATERSRSPVGSHRGTLRAADHLIVAAFLLSGVAGLGFELVWLRALGLGFGSETFGMLAVVAGFFAGLALGSAWFHRPVLRSRRPVRLYVLAECAVAAYAVAAPPVMLRLGTALPRLLGPVVGDNRSFGALIFNLAIAMIALIPATTCMGATTVAVVDAWQRRRSSWQNTTTVAWLYAANTLGATLGIVVSTYWLLPSLGIRRASVALAFFSLAAAGLAWRWDRLNQASQTHAATASADPATASPRLVYGLLLLTGFAGIGIEMVGTQVLAQVLEDTVYTFANILATYLLGTAVGAWLLTTRPLQRLVADRDRGTSVLLYGVAAGAIVTVALLGRADWLFQHFVPAGARDSSRLPAQTGVIAAIFLPATIAMGATFSHLLSYFTSKGVGYGAASNTLGATLAPFVFGLLLIPAVGYGVSMYVAIATYGVAFVAASLFSRQRVVRTVVCAVTLAGAVAWTGSPLLLVRFGPGVDVLEQRVGLFGVVSVVESSVPDVARPRVLIVDQTFQMGASPGSVEKRMGHIPMLLASPAKEVAFLGVGTGIAAGASLSDDVQRVTAVELVPEVMEVVPWFSQFNRNLEHDPRATLRVSDARRFMAATATTYDVIVADLFHPSRDGTASLYTREHFAAIRARLRAGGAFVQWLPIYQMTPRDLKTIVRTFLSVFPDAQSVIAGYGLRGPFGLIGWNEPPDGGTVGLDLSRAEALLNASTGAREVFEGVEDLLATYMLDHRALEQYAGSGPLNTDDNQRIAFDAAREARVAEAPDFDATLASLLPYRRIYPDSFVVSMSAGAGAALRQRVEPYSQAATHFLSAELLLRRAIPGELPQAAVSELLTAYRQDVKFTSAERRLLSLAIEYRAHTRELVDSLWAVRPERDEVARFHQMLDTARDPEGARVAIARFLQGRQQSD